MQDNFNLKGFLRNNRLLNEGIGGYFDLKPLKEMNFDEMNEAPGGKASLELDWAAGIPELKAQCKKHGLTCKVVDEFGPGGGNPLVKIMGAKKNIVSFLKDDYADDDQMQDFIADIQEGEMNEIETDYEDEEEDSFIQANRDAVGAKGSSMYGDQNNDDEEEDSFIQAQRDAASPDDSADQDRFWDFWENGDEIMSSMKQDGFELEDILGYIKSHWNRF